MRRSMSMLVVVVLLACTLTALLPTTGAGADWGSKDLMDVDETFFRWGPIYKVADGPALAPEVLVTRDQEALVVWEDDGLRFSWLDKDGELLGSGTMDIDLGDDGWAVALDGTDIIVVWTTDDHRLKVQRFDHQGEPIDILRIVTVDPSGIGTPSVAVTPDGNIMITYIAFRHGAPIAVLVALNHDGTTLISNRQVDPDARDASGARLTVSDDGTPYIVVTTAKGTYLMAMDNIGAVQWQTLLYIDGQGHSPDISVQGQVIAVTWAQTSGIGISVSNSQGATFALEDVLVPGMQGPADTSLDTLGIIHAIANVDDDGPALRHMAIAPGEGILFSQTVANDVPPSSPFVMAMDDFGTLHSLHVGSGLYYAHASTYAFEVASTDLDLLEEGIHPSMTVMGAITVTNRGGLVDALGFEATITPADTGWSAQVSEDEVYLARSGDNQATVTVKSPDHGPDGDTVTLSLHLWSLSMDCKGLEIDVPLVLEVDHGVLLEAEEDFVTVPPGFSEDMTVTVTNDGEVVEDIYLSATAHSGAGASGSWPVTLSTNHLTLLPQASDQLTVTVTAPAGAQEGEVAAIDIYGVVEEDMDTSARLALYAMAMPDVGLSLEMFSDEDNLVPPGGTAEYVVQVRNDGRSDSSISVMLEVVSGAGDWDAYLDQSSLKVEGGTSRIVKLAVEAPPDALEGSRFVVRVKATGQGMRVAESVDVTTVVSKESDLKVGLLNGYAEADPGQEAVYMFTVTNKGNGVENVLFRSDTPFGWEPVRFSIDGNRVNSLPLAVGETITVEGRARIPVATTSDDHDLRIMIINGEVEELDLVAHVNMVSDLWLSAAETVRDAVDGKAEFNFRIKNYGNGPDEVQLIPEGLPDGWRVDLPDSPGGFLDLAQGEEGFFSMDVIVPEDVHDEDFEFGLKALPLRGEGALVKLLVKVLTPDLEIRGIDFSTDTFVHGDIQAVSVTIGNNGPGPAGRVTVLAEDNGRTFGMTEVYFIRPGSEVTVTFTWAVQEGVHDLRFTVDPEDLVFERNEDNNVDQVRVHAEAKTVSQATLSGKDLVTATFTLSFVVVFLGAASTEWGRFKLIWLFWVPLYTKLKRTSVLDHFLRGQVYGYIKANPGEHYNAIKKALNLKNGTLVYHLQTLEREEYVKSVSDGRYKRFYPAGMKIPDLPTKRLNRIQEIILKLIGEKPGISQKEIADEIGLSGATINYHINIMKRLNAIRVDKRGRKTHCYVIEEEGSEEEPVVPVTN